MTHQVPEESSSAAPQASKAGGEGSVPQKEAARAATHVRQKQLFLDSIQELEAFQTERETHPSFKMPRSARVDRLIRRLSKELT